MSTTMLSLVLFCAAAPPVETSKTPDTMLYVRTTPAGAEILLDGKPLGTSPGLFKVPPGVRTIVIELDGHEPDGGEVTIRAGHIKRLAFRLKQRPGPVATILNQLQAAWNELDIEKLEVLLVSQASGKDLEQTRRYFARRKEQGGTMDVRFVRTEQRSDGRDWVIETTMVFRGTDGIGGRGGGDVPTQLRITPTKNGWKIAEMRYARVDEGPPRLVWPEEAGKRKVKEGLDSVAEVLRQFEAALNEMDFEKLEALFLPPDDTPAARATREILEEAKEEWRAMKARGVTAEFRLVRTEQRQDGKDTIVSATQVGRLTIPAGDAQKREKPGGFHVRRTQDPIQLRIRPTKDGWKIAEMTASGRQLPHAEPQGTPSDKPPVDSVTEVLNQFQAAVQELDVQKLEALFLPPDDTPAGRWRRKFLEEARKDCLKMKAAGARLEVRFVSVEEIKEGKDRIIRATAVGRVTIPGGDAQKGKKPVGFPVRQCEDPVQLRITPTKDGWKIAEMTANGRQHPHAQPQGTPMFVPATAPGQPPVTHILRMAGRVDYDQTRLTHVTARTAGRLDDLYVDYRGMTVRKGDRLASIYSPDLIVAQNEWLQAWKAYHKTEDERQKQQVREALLKSAEERLRLLGMSPDQIEKVRERGSPADHLILSAPVGGVLIERRAEEGTHVEPGARICTIADLSHVWVLLNASESDIRWVRRGQEVEFTANAYPEDVFKGPVAFVDPRVDERTRTVKVRVDMPNPDLKLKPGMSVRAILRSRAAAGGQAPGVTR